MRQQHLLAYPRAKSEDRPYQAGPLPALAHMRSEAGSRLGRGTWGTLLLCHSSSRTRQEPRLGVSRPSKSAALISICVSQAWEQAGLGQASAPTGRHEKLHRVWAMTGWAGLQHSLTRADSVDGPCQNGSKYPSAHARPMTGSMPGRGILRTAEFPTVVLGIHQCTAVLQPPLMIRRTRALGRPGWKRLQHLLAYMWDGSGSGSGADWAKFQHLLLIIRAKLDVGQASLGHSICRVP